MAKRLPFGSCLFTLVLVAACGVDFEVPELGLANARGGRSDQAPGRTGQTPGQSGARPPGLAGTAPGLGGGTTPDPVCGNGVRETGEACDDGNLAFCDGCTPSCASESACDDGDACTADLCLPASGCSFPTDPDACARQPDPSLSIAEGPGLDEMPVLDDATFTVRLFDALGPLTTGGNDVTVTLDGASVLAVNVYDNGDGTYTCTYRVGLVDAYTLDIRVEGTSLPGYPLTKVAQFIPSAANSTVSGPGALAVYRGIRATFMIDAVSASGIAVSSNSFLDRFSATVTGPTTSPAVTLSNQPGGNYGGQYTATEVGPHVLSVFFDGQPLSNTPVTVLSREPPVASQSSAVGAGLTSAGVNVPALFSVIARDADGVQRIDGGDDIPAEITGTAAITPAVTDNGDGTYTYIYTATAPGPYIVTITIFNENVPGSPFALTVY